MDLSMKRKVWKNIIAGIIIPVCFVSFALDSYAGGTSDTFAALMGHEQTSGYVKVTASS